MASNTSSMRDDGLRRPWGAIVAFLLPALTIYVAFTGPQSKL